MSTTAAAITSRRWRCTATPRPLANSSPSWVIPSGADWASAIGVTTTSATTIGQTLAHETPDRLPTSHCVAAVACVI